MAAFRMNNKLLFLFSLIGLFGFSWPSSLQKMAQGFSSSQWIMQEISLISAHASVDRNILRLSLLAYQKALTKGVTQKPFLTVIDYSKPSTEKRLWTFDLRNGKTLFNTWVAHGKNSGGLRANTFSNAPGSRQSSIGVFVTDQTYFGKNGYSLKLRGLEKGINDNALSRAIVVHGARYVNPDNIRKYGQIGRSWGCPAVGAKLAKPLIDTIKNKTLVFAYYPNRKWLSLSQFLA